MPRQPILTLLLASACGGPRVAPPPGPSGRSEAAPEERPDEEPQGVGGDAPATPTERTPPPPEPSGRALILLGKDTVTLGPGTHIYDRICVQDEARIHVRGSTTLVLNSNQTTVIGGRGIGPTGTESATIRIETQLSPEIFVLFDNARAPIHANLSATRSKVSVGITGKTGLNIGGAGAHTIEYNAGWGLPARFPACDAQMDREAEPSFAPYLTK